MNQKIAIIRVRGLTGVQYDIEHAMKTLNLHRKNYCVVVEKKPSVVGMLKKIANFVAYGEIDDEALKLLEEKAEKTKNKKGEEKLKPYFRLNSPKKGFGRKGIKANYSISGALGYRGNEINDLIRRML